MSKKILKIKQIGSPIRRNALQRKTLLGLGLGKKLQKTRELEDTPSVRGMLSKVQHMVEVVSSG
ncbi:MAG: 50S ribosomal protein L30, partial [Alphaproteobacteria bacterium]